MAKIKLFSGMDFSGKSTMISLIDRIMPNVFKPQKKFLTSICTLQKMIDQNVWLPRDRFIPLLISMVEEDVSNCAVDGPILQDTLWVIKFCARLLADSDNQYRDETNELLRLVGMYPDMDSFYATTTMDERLNRYYIRLSAGKRISRSDNLLFSTNEFEEIEMHYKSIIISRFPNTRTIDTTFDSPEEIAKSLLNDPVFLSDL